MPIDIESIRAAADLLDGHVVRTPSISSPALSDLTGAKVILKLENLQITGSFKPRGAFVKFSGLDEADRKAGVIAASAGNHAQGVAYFAKQLGIPATIVMPKGTPFTKVGRTESLGARVVLHGGNLVESHEQALIIADDENLRFIHPYDDDDIILGQGTIGLEMLDDHPDLEALIVPIGGGGLIAGIATAVRAINPAIEVWGVESALYPSMHQALRGEKPSAGGDSIADGIAVKVPGRLTRPIIEKLVSGILLVDEDCLENAVQVYLETQRLVVEGAGAASLGALMENRDRFAGRRVGLVVSGGNADSRLLSTILMRGLVREGRMVRLRVTISDVPGALAGLSGLIGAYRGNIVEIYHQRLFHDVPLKQAEVDVVVETLDLNHVHEIIRRLSDGGFPTRLLSNTSVDITD